MVLIDDDCVYLTQSTLIRGLSKKMYCVLCDISFNVNDLRNCAVESTFLAKSADGIHYKKINYKSVISKVKNDFPDKFSSIQAHIAGAAVKKHVESFNAYVELLNKIIDGKYDRPVHRPKKHDNRLHNIIIPQQSINSSKKKLKKGYIELPLSRNYKKNLESKNYRPRIKIPENIRDKNIVQVEIIPIN
ncbi:MAG: hypothetical protein BZ138_07015, partial [Methanosphaera sp. rholeuAM270]